MKEYVHKLRCEHCKYYIQKKDFYNRYRNGTCKLKPNVQNIRACLPACRKYREI